MSTMSTGPDHDYVQLGYVSYSCYFCNPLQTMTLLTQLESYFYVLLTKFNMPVYNGF
jgi:hypothetical protein